MVESSKKAQEISGDAAVTREVLERLTGKKRCIECGKWFTPILELFDGHAYSKTIWCPECWEMKVAW